MTRLVNAFEQFFDSSGEPLVSGELNFFESGSNTVRKTTFADIGETIPNSNPVILNGDGRCPNVFGSGTYRVVLTTSAGDQLVSRDPIGGSSSVAFGSDWLLNQVYGMSIVVFDEGSYWISEASNNIGNKPSQSPPSVWQKLILKSDELVRRLPAAIDILSLDLSANKSLYADGLNSSADGLGSNYVSTGVVDPSKAGTINNALKLYYDINGVEFGLGQSEIFNSINDDIDDAVKENVSNGTFFVDSGTADNYILSVVGNNIPVTEYRVGAEFNFIALNDNALASAANVNGLGVKNIKLASGDDPAAGQISGRVKLIYDDVNDWLELQAIEDPESIQALIDLSPKAIVNFSASGAIIVNYSENVSSITDHGVGDYSLNTITPFLNEFYSSAMSVRRISNDPFFNVIQPNGSRVKTVSSFPFFIKASNGTLEDSGDISVILFGNQ